MLLVINDAKAVKNIIFPPNIYIIHINRYLCLIISDKNAKYNLKMK